jgi:hypothetical protein
MPSVNNLSLNQRLSYIGIRLAGTHFQPAEKIWIDIEKTIYDATLEVKNDSRLFMLLCSWVSIHGKHVVIEKLLNLQKKRDSVWLTALAIFALENKFHNWKSLVKKVDGEHSLSTIKIAKDAIDYKGAEDAFIKRGFLIAKGSIRAREKDISSPQSLCKENLQYKNRLLIGSNWRADIITAIQKGYKNPYRISKVTGCSYPSAFYTFKDYEIIQDQVS